LPCKRLKISRSKKRFASGKILPNSTIARLVLMCLDIRPISMCKTEQDFPSTEAYNDYLELYEDYVFQLLNDENIQQVYAELEQFRLENRQTVEKAIRQRVDQERKLNEFIQEEARKRKQMYEDDLAEAERITLERVKENEHLLDELIASDQPASLLVAKKQKFGVASSSQALRPSSMRRETTKKASEAIASYRFEDTFSDILSDGQKEDTAPFNPLQMMFRVKPMPSYVEGLETVILGDPLLEGWIDTPAVLAGGCRAADFHLKAVQCLYMNLP
jgi:hypothetical protein